VFGQQCRDQDTGVDDDFGHLPRERLTGLRRLARISLRVASTSALISAMVIFVQAGTFGVLANQLNDVPKFAERRR